METLFQNLRYALRQLRKSPGFALTVVLTLALGIGANAAVFTLFDQVLLRMLPVEQPKELVRFQWTGGFSGSASSFGGEISNYFSYPMYKDLRDRNEVFSGVLAADRTSVGVTWQNQAEDKDAEIVSGNYFQVLGLKPALGRLFTQQDDTVKNANPVVVLGYDYWKTHFAASPAVVGQPVLVNGHSFTVIGVAPANFRSAIGGYKPGIFLPISMSEIAMPWTAPRENLTNHASVWLTLVARRKPDITIPQAEASLAPLWHSLRAQELTLYKSSTERFKKHFLDDSRLKVIDDSTGFSPNRMDMKTPLFILMSMTGLLMAICAINVATLLLLRAAGRAREMSMRYALGANRSKVMTQMLVEGGVLGLLGALAALMLAPFVANLLVRLMTHADPGAEPYAAAIDGRVLLFTLVISVLASLLFSAAPVVHFLRPDLVNTLRQNSGTFSKGAHRFRKVAVGLQITLSVVLLGSAGLFLKTFKNLQQQEVGFKIDKMVTFGLDPMNSGYGEDKTPQILDNALDAVRRVPGIVSAAATTDPELADNTETTNFPVVGYKPSEDESMNFEAPFVTPGYFATLQQPLLAGRDFTLADGKGQQRVAIVNLTLAKRFYGSAQNALGHLLGEKGDIVIVGVVGDIKHADLRTMLGPAVYRPYLQSEHPTGVEIYARTGQAPETEEAAIRKTMRQLDPTLVVEGIRTMEAQVERSAEGERALAILAIGFSALAMLLAAIGFYGVLAYSTEQRTREIGVRMALGAQRSNLIFTVMREMATIAAIAIAVALPSMVLLAKLFRSQLYGVTSYDPVNLMATLVLTMVVVALAATLPARRAASVDPMKALRMD